MWSTELVLLVVASFTLAGIVKGVIGFGLPTVTLALLTATIGLKEAMVLLLAPCFVANLWQALAGGKLLYLLRRLWSLLLGVCIATWFGASWHARLDSGWLVALLGILLCAYALVSLSTRQIPAPGRREVWLTPATGITSGILNGLTGSFVVPGVLYLQALGLPRDILIQSMGMLFVVSTVALGIAMQGNGLLPREFGLLSMVAVIPALAGMRLGLIIRRRLDERQFRQVFFAALLIFGLYLWAEPMLH